MDRQPVINDWYCRLMLEEALTELWLAKGDLSHARPEAEHFLELTLATAERTWQALAWEASARVAIAQRELHRAQNCIDHALAAMEGFEVPLAAWRVHGSAAELYRRRGNNGSAGRHRALARATVLELANSLADHEPLRDTFLSAQSVRNILGNAARITRPTPRP